MNRYSAETIRICTRAVKRIGDLTSKGLSMAPFAEAEMLRDASYHETNGFGFNAPEASPAEKARVLELLKAHPALEKEGEKSKITPRAS